MAKSTGDMLVHLREAQRLLREANEALLCANKKANPVEHLVMSYLLEDVTQLDIRLQQFKNASEEKEEEEEEEKG